jgi:hypothetical protein
MSVCSLAVAAIPAVSDVSHIFSTRAAILWVVAWDVPEFLPDQEKHVQSLAIFAPDSISFDFLPECYPSGRATFCPAQRRDELDRCPLRCSRFIECLNGTNSRSVLHRQSIGMVLPGAVGVMESL